MLEQIRTWVWKFLKCWLPTLALLGCVSSTPELPVSTPTEQIADLPLGLVYLHSDERGQYDAGNYYYYDLRDGQTRRITPANVWIYANVGHIDWSPITQQFVYASGGFNRAEIYLTDLAGSYHTPLTSNSRNEGEPQWSPDGKSIAFHSRKEDGSEQKVYVMKADGTDVRPLLNDPQVLSAGFWWAPDGKHIAVLAQRIDEQPRFFGDNYRVHIYVVEVGTGETIDQLADGSTKTSLTWSPDGQRLAYTSNIEGRLNLFVWSLGNGQQKVINLQDVVSVEWSPDGRWLALIAGQVEDKIHLYVVQPNGQNLVDLSPDFSHVITAGLDLWSPDGKCVAFSALINDILDPELQFDLYVVDIESKEKMKITDDIAYDAGASWVSSHVEQASCESIFQKH